MIPESAVWLGGRPSGLGLVTAWVARWGGVTGFVAAWGWVAGVLYIRKEKILLRSKEEET